MSRGPGRYPDKSGPSPNLSQRERRETLPVLTSCLKGLILVLVLTSYRVTLFALRAQCGQDARAPFTVSFQLIIRRLPGIARWWRRRLRAVELAPAAACPNESFRGNHARIVCQRKPAICRLRIRPPARNAMNPASGL